MSKFNVILTPHTIDHKRIINIKTVGYFNWFPNNMDVSSDDIFFEFIQDMDKFFNFSMPLSFTVTKDSLKDLKDRLS